MFVHSQSNTIFCIRHYDIGYALTAGGKKEGGIKEEGNNLKLHHNNVFLSYFSMSHKIKFARKN
jgi:hypothetical protein